MQRRTSQTRGSRSNRKTARDRSTYRAGQRCRICAPFHMFDMGLTRGAKSSLFHLALLAI
jgi:hypothetical protein